MVAKIVSHATSCLERNEFGQEGWDAIVAIKVRHLHTMAKVMRTIAFGTASAASEMDETGMAAVEGLLGLSHGLPARLPSPPRQPMPLVAWYDYSTPIVEPIEHLISKVRDAKWTAPRAIASATVQHRPDAPAERQDAAAAALKWVPASTNQHAGDGRFKVDKKRKTPSPPADLQVKFARLPPSPPATQLVSAPPSPPAKVMMAMVPAAPSSSSRIKWTAPTIDARTGSIVMGDGRFKANGNSVIKANVQSTTHSTVAAKPRGKKAFWAVGNHHGAQMMSAICTGAGARS